MKNSDMMILGADTEFTTDMKYTQLNNNVFVAGGSGAGKTCSIIEPRLLNTFNSNLFVTVSKRRIVDKYTEIFKDRAYKVYDINFLSPDDSPTGWDPLDSIASYSDIRQLAESIVIANPRKKNTTADPYWDDTAIALLCSIICLVFMFEKEPTFNHVLDYINNLRFEEAANGIETSLDQKIELSKKAKGSNNFAATCFNTFKNAPIKTAGCIASTLNSTIDSIFTPDIRKLISNPNKLDYQKIAYEKSVVFISTSPVNKSLNSLIGIFNAQLYKSLFEIAEASPETEYKLPIPTAILYDDFACSAKIDNFPEFSSIIREKELSVVLCCQSESQLSSIYSEGEKTTIINNCDTYIYMGGNDLATADNVSRRINRPLEFVLNMPIGKEFIFRRGSKPIVTERFDIFHSKLYRKYFGEAER